MVEESTAASLRLANKADALHTLLAQFRLADSMIRHMVVRRAA
jgi:methyl-accepting chemotaxis protein